MDGPVGLARNEEQDNHHKSSRGLNESCYDLFVFGRIGSNRSYRHHRPSCVRELLKAASQRRIGSVFRCRILAAVLPTSDNADRRRLRPLVGVEYCSGDGHGLVLEQAGAGPSRAFWNGLVINAFSNSTSEGVSEGGIGSGSPPHQSRPSLGATPTRLSDSDNPHVSVVQEGKFEWGWFKAYSDNSIELEARGERRWYRNFAELKRERRKV